MEVAGVSEHDASGTPCEVKPGLSKASIFAQECIRYVEESQHFGTELGFTFNMIPILDTVRNIETKNPDNFRMLQGYSFELRRFDRGFFTVSLHFQRDELN